jgi:large subunit ribosomal protein L22
MAPATATRGNRPGTRAKVRYVRMSASKARVVLNLIRGKRVVEAAEILEFTERLAAEPIAKCLNSAVANAEHNDDLQAEDLYISACYADEGPTLKRFRPRARGRAGRIHKQTCHIVIEVARLTDEELDALRRQEELRSEGRAKRSSTTGSGGDRARRVARSRAAAADEAAPEAEDQTAEDQTAEDAVEAEAPEADEAEAKVEDIADEAEDAADEATEEADATEEEE